MARWQKRIALATNNGRQSSAIIVYDDRFGGWIGLDAGAAEPASDASAHITTANMAGDLAHALEELRAMLEAKGR